MDDYKTILKDSIKLWTWILESWNYKLSDITNTDLMFDSIEGLRKYHNNRPLCSIFRIEKKSNGKYRVECPDCPLSIIHLRCDNKKSLFNKWKHSKSIHTTDYARQILNTIKYIYKMRFEK